MSNRLNFRSFWIAFGLLAVRSIHAQSPQAPFLEASVYNGNAWSWLEVNGTTIEFRWENDEGTWNYLALVPQIDLPPGMTDPPPEAVSARDDIWNNVTWLQPASAHPWEGCSVYAPDERLQEVHDVVTEVGNEANACRKILFPSLLDNSPAPRSVTPWLGQRQLWTTLPLGPGSTTSNDFWYPALWNPDQNARGFALHELFQVACEWVEPALGKDFLQSSRYTDAVKYSLVQVTVQIISWRNATLRPATTAIATGGLEAGDIYVSASNPILAWDQLDSGSGLRLQPTTWANPLPLYEPQTTMSIGGGLSEMTFTPTLLGGVGVPGVVFTLRYAAPRTYVMDVAHPWAIGTYGTFTITAPPLSSTSGIFRVMN
jgi:hypothetical protein